MWVINHACMYVYVLNIFTSKGTHLPCRAGWFVFHTIVHSQVDIFHMIVPSALSRCTPYTLQKSLTKEKINFSGSRVCANGHVSWMKANTAHCLLST